MGLLERGATEADDGELIGRDPRKLTPADFAEDGVPLMPLMKAIRAKCMDCSAGVMSEVRRCVSIRCPLWPLRMGNFPRKLRDGLRGMEDGETEDNEQETTA